MPHEDHGPTGIFLHDAVLLLTPLLITGVHSAVRNFMDSALGTNTKLIGHVSLRDHVNLLYGGRWT